MHIFTAALMINYFTQINYQHLSKVETIFDCLRKELFAFWGKFQKLKPLTHDKGRNGFNYALSL